MPAKVRDTRAWRLPSVLGANPNVSTSTSTGASCRRRSRSTSTRTAPAPSGSPRGRSPATSMPFCPEQRSRRCAITPTSSMSSRAPSRTSAPRSKRLRSLRLATPSGASVPLAQIASLSYALEPPLVWRRQRQPTVTVQADVAPGVAADQRRQAARHGEIAAFRSQAAARIRRSRRRHGGGQRQGPGQHFRRFPADAVLDGHHSDGAADELPAPDHGAADRAAGPHWRRRHRCCCSTCPWGSSPFSASSRSPAW